MLRASHSALNRQKLLLVRVAFMNHLAKQRMIRAIRFTSRVHRRANLHIFFITRSLLLLSPRDPSFSPLANRRLIYNRCGRTDRLAAGYVSNRTRQPKLPSMISVGVRYLRSRSNRLVSSNGPNELTRAFTSSFFSSLFFHICVYIYVFLSAPFIVQSESQPRHV